MCASFVSPSSSPTPPPEAPGCWNETSVAYPRDLRLHDFLIRSAQGKPDAPALTFEGRSLTYAELDQRSNQVAHHLQGLGIRPGSFVGLHARRSFEMIVGLYGILKAGGAYVPIDPDYPPDRLAFMLEDAAPRVVLTLDSLADSLPAGPFHRVALDRDWPAIAVHPATPAPDPATSADLCYMIYTSGSTGKPKGALNAHLGVVNQILWLQDEYRIQPTDTVLQKTHYSFDVSVWEFFWPILVGARMVLARPGGHQDPVYLADLIRREAITATSFVPSMLRAFLDEPSVARCTSLRHSLTIGEALTYDLQEKFFRVMPECCLLHNLYGPTEAAVSVTAWTCRRGAQNPVVPIGRPCANTQIHILDDQKRPVPVGETGELYIGGLQVGRGYHNRPELSAERFLPDPFSTEPGATLYRTGDLARWLPEGQIDFLGRVDFQVKLRGFRIELGEIESNLSLHPDVHQAVVIADRRPDRDDRLVAYLVNRTGQRPSPADLRAHLGRLSPEYMIPSLFLWVETLPQLPNGKVDRKSLPPPTNARPDLATPFAAPRTPTEKALAGLWEDLIGVAPVGTHDSFFELGGTSLLALRLVARWKQRTQEELPLVKVFQFPTIAGLARWLDDRGQASSRLDQEKRRSARLREALDRRPGSVPLAVVGVAGRFPGAPELATLWKNLCAGVESITVFSREELGLGIEESLRHDPDYTPARGIVEGAETFDAAFFGLGALEATVTDPQQRVFLELAYHALENAGIDPERPPGPIGVFAGSGDNRYYPINLLSHPRLLAQAGKLAVEYGNEKDYMAMRVSYLLGLTGPSVSANTGCSSALLAVDLAARALADFECDAALAGAVDIGIPQKSGFLYEEGGTFARDGHCRPFDADATGTMFCDGAGLVVLKRLDDALAANDTIHAVLLGTAKNNNGARAASFLAPSVEGQAEVISLAQAQAGVEPTSISYLEAHGTGTPLGDPIEVEALKQVFPAPADGAPYCRLGSIKGNIGHSTSAAGIAGFLKAVLALEHEQIPGTLHFRRLNPRIELAGSAFAIADRLTPWPRGSQPRRAAVSSYGFGGTNVHAILEEAPALRPTTPGRAATLLLVSARTPTALTASAEQLASRLVEPEAPALADTSFTLATGRRQWPHRRFVVAGSPEEAAALLRQPHPIRAGTAHCRRRDAGVVFLFGGQGTQYGGMGRELHATEPLFRAVVDECCTLLEPTLGVDLRKILFAADGDAAAASEALQQTQLTQPALFVIQYALARWWQSLGLQPAAMAGHSVGEFVAATLAGVFDLSDALRIVATRGRLMQAMPPGSMLSVRAPLSTVEPLLPAELQVASLNGPSLLVIAGPTPSVEALQAELTRRDIVAKLLKTSHAFHSAMMEGMVDDLRAVIAGVTLRAPTLPILSTVTGRQLTAEEAQSPDYWARHARVTVRFSDAARRLLDDGHEVFLECGPRATLTTLLRQHVPAGKSIAAIPSLGETVETVGEATALAHAVGQLWLQGATLDWAAYFAHEERRRVPLPLYPFERQRYWVDPVAPTTAGPAPALPVWSAESASPGAPAAPSPANRLEAQVLALMGTIAGKAPADIDREATFLDQGWDSLLLVQLTTALRNELGVKVPFSHLMSTHPTPALLVAHLGTLVNTPAPAPTTPAAACAPCAEAPSPAVVTTTVTQRGLFLSSLFSARLSSAYNESVSLHLRGQTRAASARQAIQALAAHHEALRASFSDDGRELRLAPQVEVPFREHDLTGLSAPDRDTRVVDARRADVAEAFPLPAGPLLRATWLQLQTDEAFLILTAHHVICDGWSLDVLIHDFCAAYSDALAGRPARLAPATRFSVHAREAEEREAQPDFARARQATEARFAQGVPALVLPTSYPRRVDRDHAAERTELLFPVERTRALRDFAASLGASLFHLLVAAQALGLARASGQRRFALALPVAGQPLAGHPRLVGHCVSMIPLAVDLTTDRPFATWVREVRDQLNAAIEAGAYSVTHLLSRLHPRTPAPGVRPFAVGMTSTQEWKPGELRTEGFALQYDFNPRAYKSFELYLNAFERGGELRLRASYDASLYDQHLVNRWMRDLDVLLATALSPTGVHTCAWLTAGPRLADPVRDYLFDLGEELPPEAVSATSPVAAPGPRVAIDAEAEVAAAWKKVLRRDTCASSDNFFDVGGSSLNALALVNELESRTGVRIPLTALYLGASTPAALAERIRQARPTVGARPRRRSWVRRLLRA